jgi:hypothetical protein
MGFGKKEGTGSSKNLVVPFTGIVESHLANLRLNRCFIAVPISHCPISRFTGQVPYHYSTCPVSAFIGSCGR